MPRYKQNVVKHDETGQIIYPNGTSLLQFVSDNTDHDMATLDGKNTHHGLGSIAIVNGTFNDVSSLRKRIPRDKKEACSKINQIRGTKSKINGSKRSVFYKNYFEKYHSGNSFL